MEKIYLSKLRAMVALCRTMPDTRMWALAKLNALIALNLGYEKIQTNRDLEIHPYKLVDGLVDEAISDLKRWCDIADLEESREVLAPTDRAAMEELHQALFQDLWTQFDREDYEDRIRRYEHRLAVNELDERFLSDKLCIDFGCGHGNFAHALINKGATYVLGVDYGRSSIEHAEKLRQELGRHEAVIDFKVASVYSVPAQNESFDFALQNGVFHHLADEDSAYREVHRVLKNGGWFWIYTDGTGAISQDLWDASREALVNVPYDFMLAHFKYLNITTHKRYHLGDGFNAIYRRATWETLTTRLASIGFGKFKRLRGGFPLDTDPDVIAADTFGKEKFGTGDLRLLAQKIE